MKIVVLFLVFLISFSRLSAAEPNLIDELDLSRKQVKQIRIQQRETTARGVQLREQIRQNETALKTELAKPSPDQEILKKITQQISQLRLQLLQNKIDGFVEMKKGLSQEQLRKMEQLQRERSLGYMNSYQKRESGAPLPKRGTGSGSGN